MKIVDNIFKILTRSVDCSNSTKNGNFRSTFLKLFISRKEMMKQEFLQFLEPYEMLKFSLLCKAINLAVDPRRKMECS